MAHESRELIDRIGIEPGARVLDVGCGPQGCLELFAERVGASGAVVGLEKNPQTADLARAFVRDRNLTWVEVVTGDVCATQVARSSFDLVHARLVLVNVPNPGEVLREMIGLTRPGGVVASHEADYVSHRCSPSHPSWDRLFEVYQTYSRQLGVDLSIGRRTYGMFHAAGLVDIQSRPLIHVYPLGHARRNIFVDFINNVRGQLTTGGFIEEVELASHLDALDAHLARPDVLVVSHVFLQVWGRKPATSPQIPSQASQASRNVESSEEHDG